MANPETIQQTEPGTEPPVEPTETPPESPEAIEAAAKAAEDAKKEELRELFAEAVPEFASEYDELSPEAREKLLSKRLAALSTGESAQAGQVNDETPGKTGQEPEKPPIAQPPPVDIEQMQKSLGEHFDPDQARVIMEVVGPTLRHANETASVLGGALLEAHGRLDNMDKGLSKVRAPIELQRALKEVPGATEADFPAAEELVKSGEVQSYKTALKVARSDREAELRSAKKTPTASASSKRAAAAIEASRAGGTSPDGGQTAVTRMPETQAELAALMEAEEKAKAGQK